MKKLLPRVFAALFLLMPAPSQAEQFFIVGTRALGMGGAATAAVDDSTAVYWNPAALAECRDVDIRVPVTAGFSDRIRLKDTWTKLNEIKPRVQAGEPAAILEAALLFQELSKPNTGTDLNGSAGLLISLPTGSSTVAVSALGFGNAGLYVTVDTLHRGTNPGAPGLFVGNNNSAATGIGMVAKEPAVSFATSFADRLFVGVNAKMIYADTYVNSTSLRATNFHAFLAGLKQGKRESGKASLDAGMLLAPAETVRIGVVGRNLNAPTFPVQGLYAQKEGSGDVALVPRTDEIKLNPQYRAGVAWLPLTTLTIAADYDLTRNKTLTPGYEDRTAALGLEKTFFSEYLNLRVGAHKNTADTSARTVYTAGLGLRLFALRLDVAGGYDFDKRQAEASVDLALRF